MIRNNNETEICGIKLYMFLEQVYFKGIFERLLSADGITHKGREFQQADAT